MHGIDWSEVAALAAIAALVAGAASHFTGQFRTRGRIEDAIFGYKGEPGILVRLQNIEKKVGL